MALVARSALRADGNGRSRTSTSRRALAQRRLELPVRGEAKLIKRGAPLPAGVSIGMVARR